MTIAFRFQNGTSEMILTPENSRDKQYLDLCIDGKQNIRLKPTVQECTIIEFTETKTKSVVPVVEIEESATLIENPQPQEDRDQ